MSRINNHLIISNFFLVAFLFLALEIGEDIFNIYFFIDLKLRELGRTARSGDLGRLCVFLF